MLKSLTSIRVILVAVLSVVSSWIVLFNVHESKLKFTIFAFIYMYILVESNFFLAEKAVKKKGVSWRLFFVSYLIIVLLLTLLFSFPLKMVFANSSVLIDNLHQNLFVLLTMIIGIGLFLSTYIIFNKKNWVRSSLISEKQQFLQQSFNALKSQNVIEFLKEALQSTKYLISQDPDRAVVQLEKLTTILRHLLQSRDLRFIKLGRELEIVKEYCELAEIQIGKPVQLDIDVAKEFNETQVPPLIFQMILDHQFLTFKGDVSKELSIEVYVENKNFVVVKTSLPIDQLSLQQSDDRFMNNLRERYRLYTNAADVSILSTSTHHFVKVPLIN